jgi:hypothetical protein
MPSPDNLLEIIRNKAESARSANQELATTEAVNAVKAEGILAEIANLQTSMGQSQAIVTRAVQTANMQAQQANSKAIEAAGGFDTLYGFIAKTAQTGKEVAKLTDQVRSDQEVSWFTDPARRFRIMTDAEGTYRRLENGTQQLRTLHEVSTNLTNQLSQVGALARASAQTITATSIEASTSLIEQEAAIQARKAQLDGLKYNTAGVQAVAAASDKDLAYTFQLGNFTRQEQQYELALREEERRREQFNWMKEKEIAARQEKIDEQQFEDRTVAYINLGEAARGLTPSTARQIKDHIKLNKGLGADYADLYIKGRAAATTGQAIVGNSPGESASIYARDPSLAETLPEQQRKIAALLKEATQVLGDKKVRITEGLDDDKTGAKALKAVSNKVQEEVGKQLRFVGNNPDNLFYIGDPSSYIGTATNPGVAAFQAYPLVQKVLNPAIAANVPLSDPTTVFNLTLSAIKRGDLSIAQAAADLSNVYRRMSALHRAGMDFRKFGILLPPDGGSYNVRFGTVGTVDATNYSKVADAIVKAMVRSRFQDYRTGKVVNLGLASELTRNTQGFPNE